MDNKYDPLLEEEDQDEFPQDCPERPVLITADEFYDLLMEQQEQM